MMQVAILKADKASRATRARLGDFDQLFINLLSQSGQRWESFEITQDQWPQAAADYDGFVITGSIASVNDDEGWIHQLKTLVQQMYAQKKNILGICFGAQLVASALGGSVSANLNKQWELGTIKVNWTEKGKVLADKYALPAPLCILQTHTEMVSALPNESTLLGYSKNIPHEMFALGRHVLCLQGHPEMDTIMLEEIITKRAERGTLPQAAAELGMMQIATQPHQKALSKWLQQFMLSGNPEFGRPS